jgi:hypothetical protein
MSMGMRCPAVKVVTVRALRVKTAVGPELPNLLPSNDLAERRFSARFGVCMRAFYLMFYIRIFDSALSFGGWGDNSYALPCCRVVPGYLPLISACREYRFCAVYRKGAAPACARLGGRGCGPCSNNFFFFLLYFTGFWPSFRSD